MKYKYSILFFLLFYYSCNYKNNKETTQHDATYYYNVGVSCDYNDDYRGALDNYNKAISMDSTFSNCYLNRGSIKLLNFNDTIGALNDYKKAIQLDGRNAIAYNNLGYILSEQGNDKDAADLYRICIAVDPDYYPVYYNCAYSQFQIKDYEEALKNFEKAVIYDEEQKLYAYYYMGLIYKETGEIEKAKEYLEKAKALGKRDAEEELLKLK